MPDVSLRRIDQKRNRGTLNNLMFGGLQGLLNTISSGSCSASCGMRPGPLCHSAAQGRNKKAAKKAARTKSKILGYLRESGPSTPKRIAEATGIERETVKKECQRLAKI